MIYLSILCAVLLIYIFYLHYAWNKTRRSLKEMLVENDRHTTASNANDDGDIYFKTDLDFNITYVNDATLRKTGFAADELIGTSEGGMSAVRLPKSQADDDAVAALMGLGFTRQESARAVERAKAAGAATVEDIIQAALRGM